MSVVTRPLVNNFHYTLDRHTHRRSSWLLHHHHHIRQTPLPFPLLPFAVSPPTSAITPPLVRPPIHFSSLVKLPDFDSMTHVSFYHPAYSTHNSTSLVSSDWYVSIQDISALMFRLPAYDNGGVHHGTALAVCTVIAGNETGFFTRDNPIRERVQDGYDYILAATTRYYYHLGSLSPPPPHTLREL